MIKEPFKKIGTFNSLVDVTSTTLGVSTTRQEDLFKLIGSNKDWRNRVSRIATEVLYIPNTDFDNQVDKLVKEHVPYENYTYMYRIHKLEPGTKILPHVDVKNGYDTEHIHVIHFVIQTNPEVIFTIKNEQVHMEQNSIYEINFGYEHSVVNEGDTDRVHILVELRCT